MALSPGPGPARPADQRIEQATIHPPFNRAYVTSEHPEGQLEWLGDSLGRDFMVVRFLDGWARLHIGDGRRNEDWFSFRAEVLAPFDGTVRRVQEEGASNTPGGHDGGQAGGILFEREDGVFVLFGHVTDIGVRPGENVSAGQVVAKVGNNGTSWVPHLHVGAWRGQTPLQIRVDLEAAGRLLADLGEAVYYGMAD